jgi:hypothetical protein
MTATLSDIRVNNILGDDSTLSEVEQAIPDDELRELDFIGDSHDDARWKVGDKARAWIDDLKLPAAQVLTIIGHRADYSYDAAKKYLHVSRFYHLHPELRPRYLAYVRYSVFSWAADTSEPEACLKYSFENPRASQMDIHKLYPKVGSAEETAIAPYRSLPPYQRLMYAMFDTLPEKQRTAARSLFESFLGKLKEIIE